MIWLPVALIGLGVVLIAWFIIAAERRFSAVPRMQPYDPLLELAVTRLDLLSFSTAERWRVEVMSREELNTRFPMFDGKLWGTTILERAWKPFGRKRYVVYCCPPNVPGVLAHEIAQHMEPHVETGQWNPGHTIQKYKDREVLLRERMIHLTRAWVAGDL